MHYFIAYDIQEDKLRLHVSKLLERCGCSRIQKSVFFVDGFRNKELTSLKTKLDALLLKFPPSPKDCILCLPLEVSHFNKICWLGRPPAIDIVGKRPLVKIF